MRVCLRHDSATKICHEPLEVGRFRLIPSAEELVLLRSKSIIGIVVKSIICLTMSPRPVISAAQTACKSVIRGHDAALTIERRSI